LYDFILVLHFTQGLYFSINVNIYRRREEMKQNQQIQQAAGNEASKRYYLYMFEYWASLVFS
jgi:hypothetical protein